MAFSFPNYYDAYSALFNPQLWSGLNGLPKPSLDAQQAGHALARTDFGWNGQGVTGQEVTLSYGFYTLPTLNVPSNVTGFQSFDLVQRDAMRQTLDAWSDAANVHFVETLIPHLATLKFAQFNYATDNARAFSFAPGDKEAAHVGQAWFKANDAHVANDYSAGSEGRGMYAHEVGHLLGLHAPTEGLYKDGMPITYAQDAQYLQDTRGYSVMSEFGEQHTQQDFKGNYASGPMLHDIAAIQALYGANTHTRTGDTTYGFHSDSGRADLSLHKSTDVMVGAIWDAGGFNTLDFSGYQQDQKIDLHQGAFSDVGGLKGNVAIANGTHMQHAIGGQGNDILIGNDEGNVLEGHAGNNIFFGGKGSDIMTGGPGHNTYVYSDPLESAVNNPDWITDFKTGQDVIDFTPMLAKFKADASYTSSPLPALTHTQTVESGVQVHNLMLGASDMGAHPEMMIKVIGDIHDSDIHYLPAPLPTPGDVGVA